METPKQTRWTDPANVLGLAKALGVLFLLALGGYVWLGKMEWKADAQSKQIIAIIKDFGKLERQVVEHNVTAYDWKQRIVKTEEEDRHLREWADKHAAIKCHDAQCQDTVKLTIELRQLKRQMELLMSQVDALRKSAAGDSSSSRASN